MACIFVRLTELGDHTEDTRRRVKISEIVPNLEQEKEVLDVLDKLVRNRLIILGNESAEVAHEALIREWPTLREWLDTDRANLRLLRDMTDEANNWQKSDHDESYLYRGERLKQVESWLDEPTVNLNDLERAFLTNSLQERDKQKTLAAMRY